MKTRTKTTRLLTAEFCSWYRWYPFLPHIGSASSLLQRHSSPHQGSLTRSRSTPRARRLAGDDQEEGPNAYSPGPTTHFYPELSGQSHSKVDSPHLELSCSGHPSSESTCLRPWTRHQKQHHDGLSLPSRQQPRLATLCRLQESLRLRFQEQASRHPKTLPGSALSRQHHSISPYPLHGSPRD